MLHVRCCASRFLVCISRVLHSRVCIFRSLYGLEGHEEEEGREMCAWDFETRIQTAAIGRICPEKFAWHFGVWEIVWGVCTCRGLWGFEPGEEEVEEEEKETKCWEKCWIREREDLCFWECCSAGDSKLPACCVQSEMEGCSLFGATASLSEVRGPPISTVCMHKQYYCLSRPIRTFPWKRSLRSWRIVDQDLLHCLIFLLHIGWIVEPREFILLANSIGESCSLITSFTFDRAWLL